MSSVLVPGYKHGRRIELLAVCLRPLSEEVIHTHFPGLLVISQTKQWRHGKFSDLPSPVLLCSCAFVFPLCLLDHDEGIHGAPGQVPVPLSYARPWCFNSKILLS